jgi:hypothetical protein
MAGGPALPRAGKPAQRGRIQAATHAMENVCPHLRNLRPTKPIVKASVRFNDVAPLLIVCMGRPPQAQRIPERGPSRAAFLGLPSSI